MAAYGFLHTFDPFEDTAILRIQQHYDLLFLDLFVFGAPVDAFRFAF